MYTIIASYLMQSCHCVSTSYIHHKCAFSLCHIRSVYRQLVHSNTAGLAIGFTPSRLDHSNDIIIQAALWTVLTSSYANMLRWLHVERIQFELCSMVHKSFQTISQACWRQPLTSLHGPRCDCCLVIPTSCYQQQHGRLMTGILYCCSSFLEAKRNLNHSFLVLHTSEFITVECTLGNLSLYCCKKLNALFVIVDNRHSTNKTS